MNEEDKFVGKEAIEIEVAPGSVDTEALARANFPTEAFSFQRTEKTSTPVLTMVSPWILYTGGGLRPKWHTVGDFPGAVNSLTVAHNLGVTPSVFSLTPTEDPAGSLGEYWVSAGVNSITVYNSGLASTAFVLVVLL